MGACGSGGDGRLTGAKGEYADQVDAICQELQGKVRDLGSNPAQQAKDIEAAVARIKEVPKPRDDSVRADLYIASLENVYLSLQDVDQARKVNDQGRAERALAGAKLNNERAAEAAAEYGMVRCARPL